MTYVVNQDLPGYKMTWPWPLTPWPEGSKTFISSLVHTLILFTTKLCGHVSQIRHCSGICIWPYLTLTFDLWNQFCLWNSLIPCLQQTTKVLSNSAHFLLIYATRHHLWMFFCTNGHTDGQTTHTSIVPTPELSWGTQIDSWLGWLLLMTTVTP